MYYAGGFIGGGGGGFCAGARLDGIRNLECVWAVSASSRPPWRRITAMLWSVASFVREKIKSGFWIGGREVEMISLIISMTHVGSDALEAVGGVNGCWVDSWFVMELVC